MINTYLTWKFHIPFVIIGTLSYFYVGIYSTSIIASSYIFISWLFRKEYFSDSEKVGLIAPFSGQIKRLFKSEHMFIPENFQAFETSYNMFFGYGIYFPDNLEVYDIVKNNDEIFINLKSGSDVTMVINFQKNIFGYLPKLWVFPGDRGKKGAKMGFLPMGGKSTVYISDKYSITSRVNTILTGGITNLLDS